MKDVGNKLQASKEYAIEHALALQGNDCVSARLLLIELYGLNDLPLKTSMGQLRAWTKRHGGARGY